MLRYGGDTSLARPVTYSAILHLLLLAFGSVSMLWPRDGNMLLMDVEIAGEGEFIDATQAPHQPLPVEEKQIIEEKRVIEKNIPEDKPPAPQPPEEAPQDEKKIPVNDEQVDDKKQADDKKQLEPEEEEPVSKNEEKTGEEAIPKEEEKAKIDEKVASKKEEEKRAEEEKRLKEEKAKKRKKRHKKAFMEAIKSAEKAERKKRMRQKIQEIAKRGEERRKSDDNFEKILASNRENITKSMASGKGKKGTGAGSYGFGTGLSESDYEMISSQIYPHWVVPSGVRDAENIIIEIQVELRDNGEVIPSNIKIVDEKRYATDYIFRAAADSARRAILEASPLNIPKEKMDIFRKFTLRFNLREALGG